MRIHLLLSGMVRIAFHGVLFMSNITWSSAIILNQTKIFFQSPNPGLSHVSSHSNLPAVMERADHVRLSLHLYRSSKKKMFFFFESCITFLSLTNCDQFLLDFLSARGFTLLI